MSRDRYLAVPSGNSEVSEGGLHASCQRFGLWVIPFDAFVISGSYETRFLYAVCNSG